MIQARGKYSWISNNIITFAEDGRKEKEWGFVTCLVTRLSDNFPPRAWGGGNNQ